MLGRRLMRQLLGRGDSSPLHVYLCNFAICAWVAGALVPVFLRSVHCCIWGICCTMMGGYCSIVRNIRLIEIFLPSHFWSRSGESAADLYATVRHGRICTSPSIPLISHLKLNWRLFRQIINNSIHRPLQLQEWQRLPIDTKYPHRKVEEPARSALLSTRSKKSNH